MPGSRFGIAALIIDDSASIREVLRVILESERYRVIEAADGREGVRRMRLENVRHEWTLVCPAHNIATEPEQ